MSTENNIKPNFPSLFLTIAIAFSLMGVFLLFSPLLDLMGLTVVIFMVFAAISIIIIIDRTYLKICYDGEILSLIGFFNWRTCELKHSEIKGYEVQQRADSFSGLHEMIIIVTNNNKKINIPKGAYGNYEEVVIFFESKFKFLGYKEMKHGKFYGKWLPILSLISGLLALLVAIMKK